MVSNGGSCAESGREAVVLQIQSGHRAAIAIANVSPVPKIIINGAAKKPPVPQHAACDACQSTFLQFLRPLFQISQ